MYNDYMRTLRFREKQDWRRIILSGLVLIAWLAGMIFIVEHMRGTDMEIDESIYTHNTSLPLISNKISSTARGEFFDVVQTSRFYGEGADIVINKREVDLKWVHMYIEPHNGFSKPITPRLVDITDEFGVSVLDKDYVRLWMGSSRESVVIVPETYKIGVNIAMLATSLAPVGLYTATYNMDAGGDIKHSIIIRVVDSDV
jgi:hypothetical protein